MIFSIILYFFFPITLIATIILSKKSHQKKIISFIPAIISAVLAISCYSLFLYNNGMGEFMVALLLIGITLANVALMTIIKILKVTVFS
ncbi:hypothetical protein [Bacillus cereus group sp. BfR-BA-01316]|uniref:hypothetical protein n=1 Tax=Bacillus cereus group sp. BfR-BA-01316 TaxID=2920293 RepID=UPI001F5A0CAB|nr:hypothetical protein [Bacillus cereus group sp. BfR-BA-01316]